MVWVCVYHFTFVHDCIVRVHDPILSWKKKEEEEANLIGHGLLSKSICWSTQYKQTENDAFEQQQQQQEYLLFSDRFERFHQF